MQWFRKYLFLFKKKCKFFKRLINNIKAHFIFSVLPARVINILTWVNAKLHALAQNITILIQNNANLSALKMMILC